MSLRRVYETTFIVNAALEDADIDNVLSKVINNIENHGGKIMETNKWGRRRLAYQINKKYNGFYIHLVYEAAPSTIPVIERFLVLEDTILRHLTLILPKKLYDYRAKQALQHGTAYMQMTAAEQKTDSKDARNAREGRKVEVKVKVEVEVENQEEIA